MCDISSRYQQKEPNSTTTPYEYVHLYMEMQNISYLLWKKKIEVNSIYPTFNFILN